MDKTKIDNPKDVALQLCAEIRRQYQGKWRSLPGMQCMGCIAATNGDMTKRCVSNAPGYRDYGQINVQYNRQTKKIS